MTWYLIAVSLHILAACVWIGGMVFLAAVLLPALRQPDYRGVALPLIRTTAIRFRWVGWAALLTLVMTGCANLAVRGYGWRQARDGELWHGWFGHVLGLKLLFVALVLLLSAWHDLAASGQMTRMTRDNAGPIELRRFRRRAAWVGRIVLYPVGRDRRLGRHPRPWGSLALMVVDRRRRSHRDCGDQSVTCPAVDCPGCPRNGQTSRLHTGDGRSLLPRR